jgi:hypothetical protein
MTRFLPSRKADCLTSAKKACLPYHCSLMVPKRKRRAYALLLLATFRYCFFLSNAQRRMDALQANHDERPANPCGRAHPFSSVHPYGPPCESRAEAPGPSCLCSIAQALTAAANLGKQWQGNCGSVCLADRRLAVLAHYSPQNSAQTYSSFRFPAHWLRACCSGGCFVMLLRFALRCRRWLPRPSSC